MNRQTKYPDTRIFRYYNANPKNRVTDDCVIRAICTALNEPYEKVYRELFEISIKTGYMVNARLCYGKYLEQRGWVMHKQPRKEDNTKYTGREFCERARPYENYIAHIGGHHIVAIIDGKVVDTWNSTDGCIGNYWMKG